MQPVGSATTQNAPMANALPSVRSGAGFAGVPEVGPRLAELPPSLPIRAPGGQSATASCSIGTEAPARPSGPQSPIESTTCRHTPPAWICRWVMLRHDGQASIHGDFTSRLVMVSGLSVPVPLRMVQGIGDIGIMGLID